MGNGSRSRRLRETIAAGTATAEAGDDPNAARRAQKKAHKARQRRRKNERRHDAVRAIVSRLAPPASGDAFTPLEKTRAWDGAPPIDWSTMRASCDPAKMAYDGDEASASAANAASAAVVTVRAKRKRWQVESFAVVLRELQREHERGGGGGNGGDDARRLKVVDFGAGSGNLTLPLAAAFPSMDFVAVEMKRRSADLVSQRAAAAGLSNVTVLCGMIERAEIGPFDVGVALHACGNATDHSIARCVRANAAFLVSPCCIGKLKFSIAGGSSFSANVVDYKDTALGSRPEREAGAGAAATKASEDARNDDVVVCPPVEAITHPRSRWLSTQLASENEFAALAVAADTGHAAGVPGGDAPSDDVLDIGRAAKTQVELDRAEGAREAGYVVRTLAVLNAAEAPPNKSDLIVGARRGRWRDAFERLAVAVSA